MQSDQFTPIHNEVMEELFKINLSPYEWRVLMVIFRKTYGFCDSAGRRKKTDMIALSYIASLTGLDRRLVSRAVQGLKKKGVISRDDSKTGFTKAFYRSPVISRDDKVSSVEMTGGVTSVEMPNKEKDIRTLTNVRGEKPKVSHCPLDNKAGLYKGLIEKYPKGHQECVEYFIAVENEIGHKFVNKAAQFKHIHDTLKANFSFKSMDWAIDKIKADRFYQEKGWDFSTVGKFLERKSHGKQI